MGDDGGWSGGDTDFSNSFAGADNGATTGSSFAGADNPATDSHFASEDQPEHGDSSHNHWGRSTSIEDDGRTGGGGGDILTALAAGEVKDALNGADVVAMAPMMMDEGDDGRYAYGGDNNVTDRNGCEDCFWNTVVCCDCTII